MTMDGKFLAKKVKGYKGYKEYRKQKERGA